MCYYALPTHAVTDQSICHSITKCFEKRIYTSDHKAHATRCAVMLDAV